MVQKNQPKSGSRQFWPRKRSQRIYAKVGTWDSKDLPKEVNFLGFPGYKVGMKHIGVIDNFSHSLTKGTEVTYPVTVLECPPVTVLSMRLFAVGDMDNLKVVKEYVANVKDKYLSRKLPVNKKKKKLPSLDEIKKFISENEIVDVRAKVFTKPSQASIGKKKPEVLELGVAGSVEEKIEFLFNKLGTEVKVEDVLGGGAQVDTHGVTKGKGFQGAVKRYGVKFPSIKSEKKRRHAGNVGPWTPARVHPHTPLPGQHGFHQRTEYNKWILKVGNEPSEINPSGGFVRYGFVNQDYVLVKGSVQGTRKRMVTMVRAIRPNPKYPKIAPEITYFSN